MAKKASATAKISTRTRDVMDSARVALPFVAVVAPLIVVTVYIGGLYGGWELARRSDGEAVIITDPVSGPSGPDWLSGSQIESIGRLGSVVDGRSVYDSELTVDLARSYMSSPWVRRVVWVRRQFPASVDIGLELRRPVALVKRGRHYAVDRMGVRLPQMPPRVSERSLPVVVGVDKRAPARGEAWGSQMLTDALETIAIVGSFIDSCEDAQGMRITSVDVSKASFGPDVIATKIDIHTDTDLRINWGSYSRIGAVCYGQLTTAEKLTELGAQFAEIRRLGRTVTYLDVRVSPGRYYLADGREGR